MKLRLVAFLSLALSLLGLAADRSYAADAAGIAQGPYGFHVTVRGDDASLAGARSRQSGLYSQLIRQRIIRRREYDYC
jgi:hypothetical protein